VVSKEQRRHELARAKLARQQERREAEAAKRRRVAIIAAAVSVLVVVGGVTYLAARNNTVEPAAAPSVTAEPTKTKTPKPDKTPKNSASPGVSPTAGATEPVAAGCAYVPDGSGTDVTPPADGAPAALAATDVSLELTQGAVTLALDAATAPCTVQSFVTLAGQGYFDGTTCHRLTTSGSLQVLQCGDPTGTGSGGPGYSFADETSDDMTYTRGTVAMANAGPDTNGSQFFLVYGDSQLPPDYTVFGEITGGLEVLDAIAAAGVSGGGSDGAPAEAVDIASVAVGSGG